MAKINDYFLKAIFKSEEIESNNHSVVASVSEMAKYVMPMLISDETDFHLYYKVSFNDLKNTDIDESGAFVLKQHGWTLDSTEENIIKNL